MERLTLYLFYHNYLKCHRTLDSAHCHAHMAGYAGAEIRKELESIWEERAWYSHTNLTESGEDTWLRQRRTPLWDKPDYLPVYVA